MASRCTCDLVASVDDEHCQPQAPLLWRCAHDARNVTQEGGLAGARLAKDQQGLRPAEDSKEAASAGFKAAGMQVWKGCLLTCVFMALQQLQTFAATY
jgi:hypothetical protein